MIRKILIRSGRSVSFIRVLSSASIKVQ